MHKASAKAGIEYPPSIPINNTNHYCVGNDVSVQDSQASFAAIDTPAALPSLSESQPIGTRDEKIDIVLLLVIWKKNMSAFHMT